MTLSLVSGVFVWTAITIGLAVLVRSVAPFRRHRLALALVVAVGSYGATVLVMRWVTSVGWVEPALPWWTTFWVWGCLFAPCWLAVGWRSSRLASRVASCAAVPVSIVVALILFNAYFYYIPTLGGLLGRSSPDDVTATQRSEILHSAQQSTAVDVGVTAPGAHSRGEVLPVRFSTRYSGFRSPGGWVYLPPAWWGPERARLPVIELLNGTPSMPSEWMRGALADSTTDRFAGRHDGLAPILAMVDENESFDGDSECVDRPGARAETHLLADVRYTMAHRFDSTVDARRWGIAGISEGGTCALAIGLRHDRAFRVIGDFGGAATQSIGSPAKTLAGLFDGNRALQASYDPNHLLAGPPRPGLAAMFAVGDQDPNRATEYVQARAATSDRIDTRIVQVPGGHTYRAWMEAYRQFLPFAWHELAPAPLQAKGEDGRGCGAVRADANSKTRICAASSTNPDRSPRDLLRDGFRHAG